MKKSTVLVVVILSFALLASSQPRQSVETDDAKNQRLGWWRDARFGMFIHWGVYATPGRGEWVMNRERIPVAEYDNLVSQFNPIKYDANEWVRMAKEAGMKYIVITAKHHDGFALFETRHSKWNIVEATPYGRDLLRPLAEACRREDIRLGFYYSQAQDWLNGGSARYGKWDSAQERPMSEYVDKVALPQLQELLTNYGAGVPALLWWDTPDDLTPEMARQMNDMVHKFAPSVIMNGRLGGGIHGDFDSPEGFIPAAKPGNQDWETCMTMNRSWGYNERDQAWKTSVDLIRQLCELASKGGNYLLNIGPKPDGTFPEQSVVALKEIGDWMRVNSGAIYGTQGSPFPYAMPWGSVSCKDSTMYLLVQNWPKDGKLLVPLRNGVKRAWMLARPNEALKVEASGGSFTLKVPVQSPEASVSVIAVQINGEPVIGDLPPRPRGPIIPQTEDGSITLSAVDADLEGPRVGRNAGSIVGWASSNSFVAWRADVKQPGRYKVAMNYAVPLAWANAILKVSCGTESFEFKVEPTKSFSDFQTRDIGEIDIPKAGQVEIVLNIIKMFNGGSVGNINSLRLMPVNK